MLLDPRPRPFADLVFHVLAHAEATARVPASVFDARYVALSARSVGPAQERTLAEDVQAIARLAPSHAALARIQLVAWLFRDLERASAAAPRALDELGASEVDAPELLPLLRADPAAELLRCAAELEREAFERLPPVELDPGALGEALRWTREVAPGLDRGRVACVRSLGVRGRVLGDEIWVGVPSEELGVGVEHLGWQASHEATVREVGDELARRGLSLAERGREALAVVLLARRAERAGRAEAHARWLAVFGSPDTSGQGLAPELAALLDELAAAR